MAATMNAATFMGKNSMDNQHSIMNSTDLTLKKMFDISAKLVGEQEEINNVDKIHSETHSWKHLSLIGEGNRYQSSTRKSLRLLRFCVVSWKGSSTSSVQRSLERKDRDYDGISGESTEFEWNIFPGFTTLQLCGKVTDLLSRLGETPETFTGIRQWRRMCGKCQRRLHTCKEVWYMTMVIYWSRFRKEVVFYGRE